MALSYDEKGMKEVERQGKADIAASNKEYDSRIAETKKLYGEQKKAAEDWGKTQSAIQQEQSDFSIKQIEQQKDWLTKDYEKEQKAAYTDWQKQSGEYSPEAEKMAGAGLLGSGYSETAKVNMYTAYQNRVSVARDGYTKAVQQYDNAMTQARLQNRAELAEIAYKSLQTALELNIQEFTARNSLLDAKAAAARGLKNDWQSLWLDMAKLDAAGKLGGGGLTGSGYTLNEGSPSTGDRLTVAPVNQPKRKKTSTGTSSSATIVKAYNESFVPDALLRRSGTEADVSKWTKEQVNKAMKDGLIRLKTVKGQRKYYWR